FVLFAPAPRVESVKENLFPVDLVAVLFFGLRGRSLDRDFSLGVVLLFIVLRLDHLGTRIVKELLLEMLLEVEQRHVQQIHRLIQARIDLKLLLELRGLRETRSHATLSGPLLDAAKRDRKRAVSVGP